MSEVEAVAYMLVEHGIHVVPRAYPSYECACGWDGRASGPFADNDTEEAARHHVAERIVAHLTEAARQAPTSGGRGTA